MKLAVMAHNIRSTHNVGSIFRSCDGFGVEHLYLSGYTPYPAIPDDDRLPHIADKLTGQINKTALGAEKTVPFSHHEDPFELIKKLKKDGYKIVALEQTSNSQSLFNYQPQGDTVLLLGEEVYGTPEELLELCDETVEIPMQGQKESFNVSVATGIALYAIREHSL
jgi:tRNA G18 (ribose-2'-O)-methylase SpoU